nr:circularly permuted type 2 ATP-grasp protein [Roseomonas acroporae]
MVDGRGGLRPSWRGLLGILASLGREEVAERSRQLSRALLEEVASGIEPDAGAWRCDPIPLPLAAAEFAMLEAGLAQRARLLEALLQDVYGRQELLADGTLPPALAYANPAFLRPIQAPPPDRARDGGARGQLLSFYAADLLRGPDGVWRVLADRTARGNGVAYALENRRVVTRVLPELFGGREVQRLRPFFEIWQDALQRLAPVAGRSPGIALLTPGPRDPLWFEHVMLSRELSCGLVEDGDLTARDGGLFVKTLRGLRPVDVLLRRQDGRTIDPLELEPGPSQGVAGLLDAARSGRVRIVNDPGSGFAEAPALAAFLPGLAERLLGERLLLSSVPTLWLGDAAMRGRVGDLGDWLVRPALDGSVAPKPLSALAPPARERLLRRMHEAPWEHAVSAAIQPSVAPCVEAGGFVPKPVVMRLFLVFDGTTWRALQGGLARALEPGDSLAGELPRRALCKDVWVAIEEGTHVVGPGSVAMPPLSIRRPQGDMPSRVADDFFWLGRYLERLEGAARRLRTMVNRLNRYNPSPRETAEVRALAACLVEGGLLEAEIAKSGALGPLLRALPLAARENGTLLRQLNRIGRLTEVLRDRLSGEMHATVTHALRDMTEALRAAHASRDGRHGLEPLSQATAGLLQFVATVSGLAAENMVRSGGRLFLDLGRRIERAQAVAADLACALEQPEVAQAGRMEMALRLMLELCDSAITYRTRYLTVLQPAPVLDLLLADEGNPRGLAFQLIAMRDALTEIAGEAEAPLAVRAAALLAQGRALVAEVADSPQQLEATARLPKRLRAIGAEAASLSDAIVRRYFVLLPTPRAVGVEGGPHRLRGTA